MSYILEQGKASWTWWDQGSSGSAVAAAGRAQALRNVAPPETLMPGAALLHCAPRAVFLAACLNKTEKSRAWVPSLLPFD